MPVGSCLVALKRVKKEGSTKTVFKSAVGNLESTSGMVAVKLG